MSSAGVGGFWLLLPGIEMVGYVGSLLVVFFFFPFESVDVDVVDIGAALGLWVFGCFCFCRVLGWWGVWYVFRFFLFLFLLPFPFFFHLTPPFFSPMSAKPKDDTSMGVLGYMVSVFATDVSNAF